MAQLHQDAITEIVAGTVSSYSVLGQSFTKLDLDKLERLCAYHDRRATMALHGVRSVADLRPSNQGD